MILLKTVRILLLALLVTNVDAISSTKSEQTSQQKKKVLQLNSAFWQAFNRCDMEKIKQFVSQDVEFYHDVDGVILSQERLIQSIDNNLCTGETNLLRQQDTQLSYYSMKDYGALLIGEHSFYQQDKNGQERLVSTAKYSHLWILKDSNWEMSRVISYDHQPIKFVNSAVAQELDDNTLSEYVGEYSSEQSGLITISMKRDALFITTEGFETTAYPQNKDQFFVKEMPLAFKFSRSESNKVVGFSVLEQGEPVDKATRQK